MRRRIAIACANRICNGRTDGRTNVDGACVSLEILRIRNARAGVQIFDDSPDELRYAQAEDAMTDCRICAFPADWHDRPAFDDHDYAPSAHNHQENR